VPEDGEDSILLSLPSTSDQNVEVLGAHRSAYIRWPGLAANAQGITAKLDALLPAILDKAFRGELVRRTRTMNERRSC
jgi:hypothetical protein